MAKNITAVTFRFLVFAFIIIIAKGLDHHDQESKKLDIFISNLTAIINALNVSSEEYFDYMSNETFASLLFNETGEDDDVYLTTTTGTKLAHDHQVQQRQGKKKKLKKPNLVVVTQPSDCDGFKRLKDLENKHDEVIYFSAEAGNSLNATCMSEWPHEWIRPDPSSSQHIWHEPIIRGEDGGDNSVGSWLSLRDDLDYSRFKHVSTLRFENASHRSVGEYTCRTLQTTELATSKKYRMLFKSFFLFIDDPEHPAAWPPLTKPPESEAQTVEVFLGGPAVLPCRPSHPDYVVTLKRGEVNFYADNYRLLPTEGFLVPNVTGLDFGGRYDCLYSSNYVFEERRSLIVKVLDEDDYYEYEYEDDDGELDDASNSTAGKTGKKSRKRKNRNRIHKTINGQEKAKKVALTALVPILFITMHDSLLRG